MAAPSPSTRALAQRLLAAEAANPSAADPRVHEAVRVCEKLRFTLTRLAGADGFASLLRRALALARADTPTLHGIMEKADGSMEGLETFLVTASDAGAGGPDAALAIVTHLLGLLITFIGAGLTMRLVGECWPAAMSDE